MSKSKRLALIKEYLVGAYTTETTILPPINKLPNILDKVFSQDLVDKNKGHTVTQFMEKTNCYETVFEKLGYNDITFDGKYVIRTQQCFCGKTKQVTSNLETVGKHINRILLKTNNKIL